MTRIKRGHPKADITGIRTFGYIVAGWLLLGFLLNGIFLAFASGAGLLLSVLAIAGMFWLVRSYRAGSRSDPRQPDDRLRRLAAAFPEDPLESDDIVDAWGAHVHDPEALARLRESYDRTRLGLFESGDVSGARDYLRSISLLAGESPELEERAIEEHGRAQRALEAAGDETTSEALLAADAHLQGARDALRKGEERPLDALRLATEAERLAALPRELAAIASEVEQVNDAVVAAAERHAESALAEVRGLPELAREEVERARGLAGTQEVDDALHALARAGGHVERITRHLDRLERAASCARDRLHAAEAAADEAAGSSAERAAALIAQARGELEAARPNWLEIVALAERALRLAEGRRRDPQRAEDDLEAARNRARDLRDEALAWTLTGSRRAVELLPLAQAADEAYREGENTADSGLAIAAFHRAESLALEALEKLALGDGVHKRTWTSEVTFRWRGDLAG